MAYRDAAMPVDTVTLRLVRHGQSEWNVRQLLQGQTPGVPLTATGRRQAAEAAERLAGCGAVALWSSDLLRAVQTARPIARRLGLPVRLAPALREQSYGVLQGRPSAQCWAVAHPEDPDWSADGGESARQLYDRVAGFLQALLADPPGGDIVLVTHGDTIRAAVAYLAGGGIEVMPAAPVANGAIVTVPVERPQSAA